MIVPMSPDQVQRFLNFRPRGKNQIRAHAIAVTILDCGARIEEMLQLRRGDVDLDNQLLKIHGKGQKQRLIPISLHGRRMLYKIMQSHDHDLLFCVAGGGRMSKRNSSRDLVALMKKVGITGIRKSWHTLRHSFAIAYIRAGGDVFRLQRILGHASLETTRRYVNLQTADLQSVHERFSLLATASR